jgi:alpha-galactosidase
MPPIRLFCAFVLALTFSAPAAPQALAPTPPMGWNSWDAYGLTIDEAQYRDNVKVLASLKQYGWQYAVIDEGWYAQNPFAEKVEARKYVWDVNGNLIPAVNRFPSAANGAGFKPLADWVHAQGLKFGIHILRGIPRQVVKENLPIAGTSFHAQDAADLQATCPWAEDNYGISDTPAGQAYYDAMMKLYASWGLDFIKVDCISDHPYRPTEIRQIAESIRKSGRPIVLSLSPGPTSLEHAAEVAKYAQMWRITDDHWDVWTSKRQDNGSEFPFGLSQEFDRIAVWQQYVKPGNWPDPDMLPEGALTPHPGWGEPRQSRYTQDEQRTEFTLWAISRSPVILGGNLTKLDEFTRSLMTNRELLGANGALSSGPLKDLPKGFEPVRVWQARAEARANWTQYFALFNVGDQPVTLHFTWEQLGSTQHNRHAQNLFTGASTDAAKPMTLALPAHGSAMFRVY